MDNPYRVQAMCLQRGCNGKATLQESHVTYRQGFYYSCPRCGFQWGVFSPFNNDVILRGRDGGIKE